MAENREGKKIKVYPANLDAERSVLASFMMDSKALDEHVSKLTDKDFSDANYKLVFEAVRELYAENHPVDLVSVSDKMRHKGTLEKVGDFPYLTQIVDSIPSAAGCQYYVDILKRNGLLRELLEVSKDIAENVYVSDSGDQSLAYAQERILKVTQSSQTSALTHVGEIVDDVVRRIEEQHANPESSKGLLTGFGNLDYITNGLQKSDLIILAARPGVGKTAFALNIANNIAERDEDKNILIFSLEMASGQLVQRMLSSISGVSNSNINSANLEMGEFVALNNARQKLWKSKIFVDQTTLQTPADILNKCRRFMIEHKCNIDLIIVDYLQLMTFPGKENRQQEVAEISRRMKLIAKEINTPLILLSQMSRSAEVSNDKPQLHDLRDSGAIEQDADIVTFLYKKKNQPEDDVVVELIVAKHRNGKTDNLALEWHGDTFRFKAADKDRLKNISTVETEEELAAKAEKKKAAEEKKLQQAQEQMASMRDFIKQEMTKSQPVQYATSVPTEVNNEVEQLPAEKKGE